MNRLTHALLCVAALIVGFVVSSIVSGLIYDAVLALP